MKSTFQYVLLGVGLIFLTIGGALFLGGEEAKAIDESTNLSLARAPKVAPREVASGENREPEQIEVRSSSSDAPPVEQRSTEGNEISFQATADNPVTDIDTITLQVSELITKYEQQFPGETGWFYRKVEHYSPPEYHSNTGEIFGVPVEGTRPEATMFKEQWFLIDETLHYDRQVGHDTDQQSIVRNRWAITDGMFVHLTYVDATEHAVSEAVPREYRRVSWDGMLELLNVATEHGGTVEAWRDGDEYMLVMNQTNEEPIQLELVNVSAIGTQKEWVIDLASGAIKSQTTSIQTEDSSWVIHERKVTLVEGMVEQPPAEALQTLQEAAQIVQEGQ